VRHGFPAVSLPTLLAFSAASLLLAATPGPDMTLSISRALSQGKRPALYRRARHQPRHRRSHHAGGLRHFGADHSLADRLPDPEDRRCRLSAVAGVQAIRFGSKLSVEKVEEAKGTPLSNIVRASGSIS
jgi:hypothetical protein